MIIVLFLGIIELSENSLQKNGSGKVPLVSPHDASWYQIQEANSILAYVLCGLSLVQQLAIHSYFKFSEDSDSKWSRAGSQSLIEQLSECS